MNRYIQHTIRVFLCSAVVILMVISCQSNQNVKEKSLRSQVSSEFQSWLESFPDSLVDHFPIVLEGAVKNYGSGFRDSPMKIKYITLVKEMSEEEYEFYSRREETPNECLLKIYQDRNEYGFNYAQYENCEELFPIPEMKLLTDIDLGRIDYYMVEMSKDTFYYNDQYLRQYLPDEWKNGMSRGVGISEGTNSIIYWLIMW